MPMNDEILNIKKIILETVDCEKIFLFGSYAYGIPHKDSDYDFYVVLKDSSENPVLAIENIYWNLRLIKRKTPVDILAKHKTKFNELSQLPALERKIVREGVLLYDSSESVRMGTINA
jgi:predicted nucleotidyltransferase